MSSAYLDELDDLPGLPARGRSRPGRGGRSVPSSVYEEDIRAGDALHPAIVALAMRGYSAERLEALVDDSAGWTDRPERMRECLTRDIPQAVKSAGRKQAREFERLSADMPPPPKPKRLKPAETEAAEALVTIAASSLLGVELKPQRWTVRDLLPSAQPAMLSGDGGLGKSTLAMHLGLNVATGAGFWLDRVISHGPVLYYSCEDELEEMHRRLDRMTRAENVSFNDLGDLHLAAMAEADALLAATKGGKLSMTPLFEALAKRIEQLHPALVVLDSLADVFGGNEIVRSEVRWFVGQLRQLCHRSGCTVLILAHPSLTGLKEGTGSSGSTHWNNAVRARLNFTASKDGHRDERMLEVVKSNRSAMGKKIHVRYDGGVFVPMGGGEDPLTDDDVCELFLTLLDKYAGRDVFVNAKPSPSYAPKFFADDPVAKAKGVANRQLRAAMDALFDAGQIAVESYRASGHEHKRIVRVVEKSQ